MTGHVDGVEKKKTKDLNPFIALLITIPIIAILNIVLEKVLLPAGFYHLAVFIIVLAIANLEWVLFTIRISANKAWIFRIIKNEAGNDTIEFVLLMIVSHLVFDYLYKMQLHESFMAGICLTILVLSVVFISNVLTRTMGMYIFLISRMDDEKMKTEIPDNVVFESLSHKSDEHYQIAKFGSAFLFLFLIASFFAELSPSWRALFIFSLLFFFYGTGACLYLSKLYEKSAMWLQMSVLAKYLRELPAEAAPFPLHATAPMNLFDENAKVALRTRLAILKLLSGLLLVGEVVAFFVLLKLAG